MLSLHCQSLDLFIVKVFIVKVHSLDIIDSMNYNLHTVSSVIFEQEQASRTAFPRPWIEYTQSCMLLFIHLYSYTCPNFWYKVFNICIFVYSWITLWFLPVIHSCRWFLGIHCKKWCVWFWRKCVTIVATIRKKPHVCHNRTFYNSHALCVKTTHNFLQCITV